MNPGEPDVDLAGLLARIPVGWSRVEFGGHPYGLSRRDRVGGRTVSIWAEQLDGTDVVSANLWLTSIGWLLKPCEMPSRTVIDFLVGWSA